MQQLSLYTIASIIVTNLGFLDSSISWFRGLSAYLLVFLDWKVLSAFQAGGGIGIQLYNPFFLLVITLIISVQFPFYGS